MQKMERYYGFRVDIDHELDPHRIEAMKRQVDAILAIEDFNPEEYFLYIHQLSITLKPAPFGPDGELRDRLERVELTFQVNPKQRANNRIRIYNFLLDEVGDGDVKRTGNRTYERYFLTGEYLSRELGFKNEIYTFISRDLRPDHRKLKLSVLAYPTSKHLSHFHRQTHMHQTQLDMRFEKKIGLRAPDNARESTANQHSPRGTDEDLSQMWDT